MKITAKFKHTLKRAEDACANTKICEAKTCANCKFMKHINGEDICTKLDVIMHDLASLVCDKWRGSLRRVLQLKSYVDVIAWTLIDKMRDEQAQAYRS